MSHPSLTAVTDETLDPTGPAEWSQFRVLAHQMVDDMVDHLSSLREQPAWRPMPDEVRAAFTEPFPWHGQGAKAAYRDFLHQVLPYPNGNLHPRYWGWVQGNGTPLGMMADMLASGMNPHLAGFNQAPALVEHQVLAWLSELMGFPAESSGVLVTGGSMANVLGVTVARFAALRAAGHDVRERGVQTGGDGVSPPRLVCYGSTETHGWARKAVELLGLGNAALPCCVIATAATVNTGAIDDLTALAGFCQAERIWLHVDGAFGALLRLSEGLRHLVKTSSSWHRRRSMWSASATRQRGSSRCAQ